MEIEFDESVAIPSNNWFWVAPFRGHSIFCRVQPERKSAARFQFLYETV